MTTNTLFLLLLSLVIASGFSYFQYYYNAKTKLKVNLVLAFLRFLSIFLLLLLLINPIITRKSLEIIKTPLAIVVDNSSSIEVLKAKTTSLELFRQLYKNKELKEKFDVQSYQFDSEFQTSEKFDFKGKQTNIDLVAKNFKSIFKNNMFPSVIITDGNQTTGNDYIFSFQKNNTVFPLVVGDTTSFLDFKVNHVNVNKYAFHKNKFPVEVFLQYSGSKSVNANFSISQGNTTLSKENISFSSNKKSAIITLLLPAEKVGTQVFKATISSNEKEKNTYNNSKNFAIDIIDQKTNVAIVSLINHPDIGMLKRAIETNAQRKVTIIKPSQIKTLEDYNLVVLYQPTNEFKTVFDNIKTSGVNTLIITGLNTDFTFLNQQQNNLDFKMSAQKEDYLSEYNSEFNLFAIDNLGFENFPPLQNPFGTITTKGNVSILLSSTIRNIKTNAPILAFVENQNKRSAFLLGENCWKWRLQSHVENQSFEKFDLFIDKIIQFLTSNNVRKSLVVEHENFYNSGEYIEISAQYFNKNYEFDEKAKLTISIKNTKTKQNKNYDLLKRNTCYKANFDGLLAGTYDFLVKEINSNTSYSGHFEVLDFDIEKQFVNPDVNKLKQLASETNGSLFYPNQVEALIKKLLDDENYKSVQKEIIKKEPLIDWTWLLILIAISLASEWFIRKYNGLL